MVRDGVVPNTKATVKQAKKLLKAERAAEKRDKKAQVKAEKKAKATKKVAAGTDTHIRALELAKERYKAKGDVSNCGDWLAVALKDAYIEKVKGKKVFDLDGFTKCCKDNGLDVTEKWATNRSPGWQGRFRMNGRQKLEIVLARNGHVVIKGKKEKPTGVFLKAMVKKHPEHEEIEENDED